MQCPYCGEEMEKGAIYGRRDVGLPWYPENERLPAVISENIVAKRNGLLLGKGGVFPTSTLSVKAAELETYICRKCRKGIFSY